MIKIKSLGVLKMSILKKLFQVPALSTSQSVVILVIRIVVGLAFMFHGYGKIQHPFSWMGPDAGIPSFLQFLAALSEFGGGLAWIIGLFTPLASLGIASTMVVATHMHMLILGDSFVASGKGAGSYELPLVYLCISILILVFGAGKFSLDRKVFGEK